MATSISNNVYQNFKQGSILAKIIYLNAAVFLAVRLTKVIATLTQRDYSHWANWETYLQLPASLQHFADKPWTVITYMFTHSDFLHALFNMLWLYWFGKMFLDNFNPKQLGGVYIAGGIAGALLFVVAYNLFPYFDSSLYDSTLTGASASVMAVVFAVSFYRKNLAIPLLIFGQVKLIYIACVVLIVDLCSIASSNAGGHIAHIGGAVFGILFAQQLGKGHDITSLINKVIDKLVNLGKGKQPVYSTPVTHKRVESDMEYNERKNKEMNDLNTVLDKLKHSGYNCLSDHERKILFDASKN
jgi:membrane associated rhomboid family serine protease